ncbi:MAG: TolC family protein [Acidobacteriaceae bacterium]|jgi:cobalt-zinc-cadmium efflux system outer membrane protein|nr:TolC family protein [Acidobacteriaceae bacterium]
MRLVWRTVIGCVFIACAAASASAETPLTWAEVRDRALSGNPALQAGRIGIDESKTLETTAFLRPNPQASLTVDQVNFVPTESTGGVFDNVNIAGNVGYLIERQQKRELRRDSAKGDTAIAVSTQADLERNLVFSLRNAFVQVLQAQAFRALAETNLANYDQGLALNRERLRAGDIAQLDFDRLELQRVQYEADVQTALVTLRTAKIQLLRLMNDKTPVDAFDVTGPYDFTETLPALDTVRQRAIETRPDLQAALQAVDKAKTDQRLADANGSVDPTVTVDGGYMPPLNHYVGVNVSVPLRIFDRNQGEKLRTKLDVTRTERLTDDARLQVLSDVDTAYATIESTLALLRPYKTSYLDQATRVRDTMSFSYQRGGASLIDFLQAQQDYRDVQVAYVNLIAAFLNAVNQLNLAVGHEVLP